MEAEGAFVVPVLASTVLVKVRGYRHEHEYQQHECCQYFEPCEPLHGMMLASSDGKSQTERLRRIEW